ncbi:hypothetical protein WN55_10223 [Dufourea novaeangliae]|uniref:Uncharacterized protein n=1 Tax=Dufourea novaeangliae TaxID=178035 RepID=A0A154P4T8_DUFNO|nr:hypothetical protein WN55_10223 [Dufourea novaeangliae]
MWELGKRGGALDRHARSKDDAGGWRKRNGRRGSVRKKEEKEARGIQKRKRGMQKKTKGERSEIPRWEKEEDQEHERGKKLQQSDSVTGVGKEGGVGEGEKKE